MDRKQQAREELYPLSYLRTCLLFATKEELANAEKALAEGKPWAGNAMPEELKEARLALTVYRWPELVDRAFRCLLRELEADCEAGETPAEHS